jgi:Putative peptidoglycan binding domain
MAIRCHGEPEGDDDWFADADLPGVLETDPPSAKDDWLIQPAPTRRSRPDPAWTRIGIVAIAIVVLVLAGLAAGGVFSGSSAPRTLPLSSITVTPPATTSAKRSTRAAALPSQTLKPGDSGAQVRELQRALKSLGYTVGTVDGQYGPATKSAVAAFQHTAGLTEDGVFGPKTLDALIQRTGP